MIITPHIKHQISASNNYKVFIDDLFKISLILILKFDVELNRRKLCSKIISI